LIEFLSIFALSWMFGAALLDNPVKVSGPFMALLQAIKTIADDSQRKRRSQRG